MFGCTVSKRRFIMRSARRWRHLQVPTRDISNKI
jgi:hypothetical protein